jgi:hypothetical protein
MANTPVTIPYVGGAAVCLQTPRSEIAGIQTSQTVWVSPAIGGPVTPTNYVYRGSEIQDTVTEK